MSKDVPNLIERFDCCAYIFVCYVYVVHTLCIIVYRVCKVVEAIIMALTNVSLTLLPFISLPIFKNYILTWTHHQ